MPMLPPLHRGERRGWRRRSWHRAANVHTLPGWLCQTSFHNENPSLPAQSADSFLGFLPSSTRTFLRTAECDVIHAVTTQGTNDFHLFVANTVGAKIGGRFHCDKAKKLQQMVLHHVAQGAGGFVVPGAPFYPECFRGGDLDVIDVARVPDWLENRIGETENENVLRRLLPEKMIDAVSLIFGEDIGHDPI